MSQEEKEITKEYEREDGRHKEERKREGERWKRDEKLRREKEIQASDNRREHWYSSLRNAEVLTS